MIIEINDSMSVAAIQEEFRSLYPFLKIEFYDIPHEWRELSPWRHRFAANAVIGAIRNKHGHGLMELHGSQKVGEVEQAFRKHFGLNVQVFRKQGEYWIQTGGTDELTLEEQNAIGCQASINHDYLAYSVTQQASLL